ncbi:uncharacterized protein LOC128768367 isoform X3 [Synchiropus splendidus]|uniref:uncharacterized protein LOC128768367 isoform X3 n=1 Tax=Synchiropus splendidus TaxID=270530 RepID=UPI00237E6838|nr:uncharacterized protein LOC128768367 isoform X3 [Synchiropus splendidus]
MDAVTRDLSPRAKREMQDALKQPRTVPMLTEQNSGAVFPQHLVVQKSFSSSSLTSTSLNNTVLTSTGEYKEDRKQSKQPEGVRLNSMIQQNKTSQSDAASGSPEVCLFTPAIDYNQAIFSDPQEPCLSMAHNAASAITHKSESSDVSSFPDDCEQPGKSLEDNPPGACRAYSRHGNDETQVHSGINEDKAITLRSVHKEFSRIPYSQAPKSEENTEKEYMCSNSVSVRSKREEAVPSHIAVSDDGDLSCTHHEEESYGNAAVGEKGEREKIELQICENVPVSDGGTENQVNEYDTSKKMISDSLKCTKGSVERDDVEFGRNVATQSACLNDLCEKRGKHAAGEMTAMPQSEMADHTTVILIAARISQEAAEGDNEASPFVGFDPAICREPDRVSVIRCHGLECAAGVELSPSSKASEINTALPLSGVNLDQAERSFDQSRKASHDENKDSCQLASETQSYSITANEIHDVNGDESCQQTFSPSSCQHRPENHTAGDNRHECLATVGDQFKDQSHSCPSSIASEHLEMREVRWSQQVSHETRERQEQAKEKDGSTVHCDDWIVEISDSCGETLLPDESGASWCLYDHSYRVNNFTNDDSTSNNRSDLLELTSDECNVHPSDKDGGEDFYLTSEAVVPGQNDSSPGCQSQNVVTNSSAQNTAAPVPCVLTHSNQFETFEKIHLSPDDDNDQDLGSRHLLTSLQGQLLKTLQWGLDQTMPGAERDEHMFITPNEAEEKGKVENSECHIEKTHESVSSDLNGKKPLSDVKNQDQQDDDVQDVLNTDNKTISLSCQSTHSEFEMKEQFELVLKELNLYFESGRSDAEYVSGDGSNGKSHDTTDVLDVSPSVDKKSCSSPEEVDDDDALPDCSQEICGGVSAVFTVAGNHSGEQEVPHSSVLCQEECVNTREKPKELPDADLKRKWSPSFDCAPQHYLTVTSAQTQRLGPLRTCMRPIRLGLSKRAKTKRLHRHHPYE